MSGFKDSKVKAMILFQFGMTLHKTYYNQEKKIETLYKVIENALNTASPKD